MRTFIAVCLTAVVCLATTARGQDSVEGIDTDGLDEGSSLELPEQVTDPAVKEDGTYSSQAVGKKNRWQLDSGEFDLDSTAPKPKSNEVDEEGYSGIRLRLPTKPAQ